jgi:hypothetical protein
MPENSPELKTLIGRASAYKSWANTPDRAARTAPARRAMLEKFEREVDPNNELTPAERAKRAEYARKAHFTEMAIKSAKVRGRRKSTASREEYAEKARLAEQAVQEALAEKAGGAA